MHGGGGSRASENAFELCRRHRRPENAAIRPTRVNPIDVVANRHPQAITSLHRVYRGSGHNDGRQRGHTAGMGWHCPVIAFARRPKHRHGVKGGTTGGTGLTAYDMTQRPRVD